METLAPLTALTRLELSTSCAGDQQGSALLSLLPHIDRLTALSSLQQLSIDLSSSGTPQAPGPEAQASLAAFLRGSPALQNLTLVGVLLGAEASTAALQQAPALQTLECSGLQLPQPTAPRPQLLYVHLDGWPLQVAANFTPHSECRTNSAYVLVQQGSEEEAAHLTAALTHGALSGPQSSRLLILSAGKGVAPTLDELSSARMLRALAAGAGRLRKVHLDGFCLTGPSTTSLLSALPDLDSLVCRWVGSLHRRHACTHSAHSSISCCTAPP